MTEVMFYHLEHKGWEQVLTGLLSRTLERGWRSVVQTARGEDVEKLSELLWVKEIFLAHGTKQDGRPDMHPIWLTSEDENPNSATVRFYIQGAEVGDISGLARAVILFDGRDEGAVVHARDDWKRLKAEGHDISYWQQDENMRWVNKIKQAS